MQAKQTTPSKQPEPTPVLATSDPRTIYRQMESLCQHVARITDQKQGA